ncbi:MAG: hypothetical protein HDR88_12910 [Bacteroides sp.]|nr:hypothetical protein [Bacteroides sp.]
MEALSVSDYRNNLAASFHKAANGEPVLIRRKNKLYTLTSVGNDNILLTPEHHKCIEEAEQSYSE